MSTSTVKDEENFSALINECEIILSMIENEQLTIDQLIKKLAEVVVSAEKLRRDILISKTTGTSATVVGSVLTIIGFCLTPFTLGISTVVLPAIGASIAGAGALTNIGDAIADGCLTSNQAAQISDLLEEFKKSQDDFHSKEMKLLKELKHYSETEQEECSYDRQLDVSKWLENGHLHRDEAVNQQQLKKSDHIFRAISGFLGFYHHAIYIDEKTVVELGGGISSALKSVQKISLAKFTDNQPLYRRDYRGFALSPIETEELAMEYVKCHQEYNLLTNNCEHFATYLKLKVNWSGQVNEGFTITTKVGQNIARPISLILDGVEAGTQISAFATKSTGLLSIFTAAPVPMMSTLAKVSVIMAPITIGIDIASLVYAYKEENESVQICNTAIADLKKKKLYLKERVKLFNDLKFYLNEKEREDRKRLEALKIEIERKCKEALQIEQIKEWFGGSGTYIKRTYLLLAILTFAIATLDFNSFYFYLNNIFASK